MTREGCCTVGIPPPPSGFAGFVRAGPGARALTDGDMRAAGDIIVPCGAKLLRRSRKASTAASEGNMLWRPVSGRLMVLTLIVSGNALMVPANDGRLLRAVQDASSQQRSTCEKRRELIRSVASSCPVENLGSDTGDPRPSATMERVRGELKVKATKATPEERER